MSSDPYFLLRTISGAMNRSTLALALCLITAVYLTLCVGSARDRIGDRIQIALPVVGLACSTMKNGARDYVLRFAGAMTVVHGLKNGLGETPLNLRPGGSDRGFPSGHTAASAYGASYLARECGSFVPWVGPVVVLSAGFVAGSRVESGHHDLVQVMAGALVGVAFDRVGRSHRAKRRRRASGLRWRRRVAGIPFLLRSHGVLPFPETRST